MPPHPFTGRSRPVFRRVRSIHAFFLLLAFLASAIAGCNLRPEPAPSDFRYSTGFPHDRSRLTPDPAIRYGRLNNGVRYVLMHNETPKNRVSLHLVVQVGSYHEAKGEEGLAHFLEHMAFNGSRHFPPGRLVKYFQEIGMDFGGDANAHTGFYETVYDVDLPGGEASRLADGLLVLRDYAGELLLLPEEIGRERNVVLSEMRDRDSAGYRTFVRTFQFELPEARISRRMPIGLTESLNAVDRNLMARFYDAWYRPERMILILAGDTDIDAAETLIRERFGDLTARAAPRPVPEFGPVRHHGLRFFHHYEAESGQTEVSIQVVTGNEPEPDSLELETRELTQDLADTMLQHRLTRIISTGDAPLTEAHAGSGIFLRRVKYAAISGNCAPDQWAPALTILENELRRALEFGFARPELDRAKAEWKHRLEENLKTAATRESAGLTRLIRRHLSANRVLQSPRQEWEQYMPVLKRIRLADVNAAFRAAWSPDPDHRLIQVTGNADLAAGTGGGGPEALIHSVYERARKQPVSPPETAEAGDFPYLPAPAAFGVVVSRTEVPDTGILLVDFENGLRLNIKSTPYQKNQVMIRLNFGRGRAGLSRHDTAVAAVADGVINGSGTGARTVDELEAALAGHGISLYFSTKRGEWRFSGGSTTDELGLLLELLRTRLADPAFRPEALKLARDRFVRKASDAMRTVDGVMSAAGVRFLAGGDPRFGMPDAQAVARLTVADIQRVLGPDFASAGLELSVVGDVDPEEVIRLTAASLGALPSRDPRPRGMAPALFFPAGDRMDLSVDSRIDKGLVQLSWPTGDIRDIGRSRRLSLLGHVFSDRMREEIRENMGAAYSPAAFHQAGWIYDGNGALHARVTLNPEDADRVAAAIRSIAADLAAGHITEEEVNRARRPVLNGIKKMRGTNEYWMSIVLSGCARHPEQLDWSRTIEADYAAITAEELKFRAAHFLKPDTAAEIRILPNKAP